MSSSVWIDERGPRRLGWLLALLGLLVVALTVLLAVRVWQAESRVSAEPVHAAAAQSLPPSPLIVMPPVAAVANVSAATVAAGDRTTTAVHCPYQRLDIVTSRGGSIGACVAATRATQSGDLRSYWLEAQGVSSWSLRLDTGLGGVMAAQLSSPEQGTFRCEGSDCAGMRIGPRDAQGGRSIDISNALLVREGDVAGSTVSLSARLGAPGDEQDPGLACGSASIAIVERSGAVLALCPSGGGGMVVLDGHRVYRLRGAAGDTLEVGIDDAGTVDLVQIGDLGCRGMACSGASSRPGPDAGSESGRRFTFSGTTVSDGRPGGGSATLNGSAVLPDF